MALFETLPNLRFGTDRAQNIEYVFPGLNKPPLRKRQLRDRAEGPSLHPALKSVFHYLLSGTGKLKYGRTSDAQWRRYMRFPCERLPVQRGGRYSTSSAAPSSDRVVNTTAELANRWFRGDLLEQICRQDRPQIYLVGDPGAGKSTLMKYLINTNHDFARDRRIIFSRFEYLKFSDRWWRSGRTLAVAIEEYISFILLRDAVYFYGYNRSISGNYAKRTTGRLTGRALKGLFNAVARTLRGEHAENAQWRRYFAEAMKPDTVDKTRLVKIPHAIRVALLSRLEDTGGDADRQSKYCLIMDGLDCISIEDFAFDKRKDELLKYVMEHRDRLTTFEHADCPACPITAVPLFIMRENTFDYFNQWRSIDISLRSVFRVDPIDPEVTIHNAVVRATDAWFEHRRTTVEDGRIVVGAETEAMRLERKTTRQNMVRSVMLSMRIINNTLRIGKGPTAIYALFGANIRGMLEFIHKLLLMFIDDAIDSGDLQLSKTSSPEGVLAVLDSGRGMQLIKTKRYRLIELLLFSYLPWFENAIIYRTGEDDDEGAPQGREFWDNRLFSGLVDNIFNYSTPRHADHPDLHCLLEKVRILQTIHKLQQTTSTRVRADRRAKRRELILPTQKAIREEMKRLTGYEPSDLAHSLHALMRTEMIRAHVGEASRRSYQITPLGEAVARSLCRDMSYIEHVFHGTLLPAALVTGIRDDRRAESINNWTAASIRNVFIWLSYLRFVEGNNANGVAVHSELRIFDDTHRRVSRSLQRILRPHRDPERRAGQQLVVKTAVRDIENLVGQWRRIGVVAPA